MSHHFWARTRAHWQYCMMRMCRYVTKVTWCNTGKTNIYETQMLSLDHTGKAMGTTVIIHIPGRSVSKSGDPGLKAVLRECGYNKHIIFNLLSLSKLIHWHGWEITHSDKRLFMLMDRGGSCCSQYILDKICRQVSVIYWSCSSQYWGGIESKCKCGSSTSVA